MNTPSPEEEIAELNRLCQEKNLETAVIAIAKFKAEFIEAASRARIKAEPRKISPFLYQLR